MDDFQYNKNQSQVAQIWKSMIILKHATFIQILYPLPTEHLTNSIKKIKEELTLRELENAGGVGSERDSNRYEYDIHFTRN